MMAVSDEYTWVAIGLSLLGLGLALLYAYRVSRAYRIWHDERAAVALAKGIGLLVIASGLTISSVGLLIDHGSLTIAGLSISRGAFVVLLATLVLADVRPSHGGSHGGE